MVQITKGGAVFRAIITFVVAFVGAVLLVLQGVPDPTWAMVLAPSVVLKGLAAAGFALERFVNTAWAQANGADPTEAVQDAVKTAIAPHVQAFAGAAAGAAALAVRQALAPAQAAPPVSDQTIPMQPVPGGGLAPIPAPPPVPVAGPEGEPPADEDDQEAADAAH